MLTTYFFFFFFFFLARFLFVESRLGSRQGFSRGRRILSVTPRAIIAGGAAREVFL